MERLVDGTEEVGAPLVAVNAATFSISLLLRFSMASRAWLSMAHAGEMCYTSLLLAAVLFESKRNAMWRSQS